jgi:hypothetical protein
MPLEKQMLVERRLHLGNQIAHYRFLVKANYHPEFFRGLIAKALAEQAKIIEKERYGMELYAIEDVIRPSKSQWMRKLVSFTWRLICSLEFGIQPPTIRKE